jgi:hypothetical protein
VVNAQSLLKPAGDCFFADQERLTTPFGENLTNDLIPRKEATFRALQAAGVRQLSDAVRMETSYSGEARVDTETMTILRERSEVIDRIAKQTGDRVGGRADFRGNVKSA